MIQLKTKLESFNHYLNTFVLLFCNFFKPKRLNTNLISCWLGCLFISCLSINVSGNEHNLACSSNSEKNNEIHEGKYVQIGGVKQWITINGKNCNNPVVLMVHGGPGNPLSIYHNSLFKEFEEDFTIVHWDQRGAGRTYQAQFESGKITLDKIANTNLTVEQLVRDGIEVSDYLINRFGQEKIIISGSSWGSFLTTKIVHESPDNFHFYVGLSQLVNGQTNYIESYKKVKSIAKDKNDKAALTVLNKIGPPIWSNPANFGKLRRLITKYENQTIKNPANWQVAKEYIDEVSAPGYMFAEEFSFLRYIGLDDDGMIKDIKLDECCTQFKIPVYLIQGQKDLLTVPSVTQKYYEKIEAPEKELTLLEHTGHDQTIQMAKMQLIKLKEGAAKFVK